MAPSLWKKFAEIAAVSRYKASRTLVLLVLANVLEIVPSEKGDSYVLKDHWALVGFHGKLTVIYTGRFNQIHNFTQRFIKINLPHDQSEEDCEEGQEDLCP